MINFSYNIWHHHAKQDYDCGFVAENEVFWLHDAANKDKKDHDDQEYDVDQGMGVVWGWHISNFNNKV